MNERERTVGRRLLHRELRAARTTPAVVVAVVLLAAAAALAVLAVWAGVDATGASTIGTGAAGVRTAWAEPSWRAAIAAGAAVVGLVLVVLALSPGHRRRHGRVAERVELVVDDGLLADAAAHAVAERCALPASQVSATVTARRVLVRIRPVSGVPVDRTGAADAAGRALGRLGFTARPVVTVAAEGIVA